MLFHGVAMVSTVLMTSWKRVVDPVGHFKKRETQVIANNNYAYAA